MRALYSVGAAQAPAPSWAAAAADCAAAPLALVLVLPTENARDQDFRWLLAVTRAVVQYAASPRTNP